MSEHNEHNEHSEHNEQLERRYERILALYPDAYRAEYADEMMGVLLSAARPDQRRPALREAANLIGSALWMRLSGRGVGVGERRWQSACAVFGMFASMVILTLQLSPMSAYLLFTWRMGEFDQLRPMHWAPPLVWAVAVVAAFTRQRLVAALAAWTGAGYIVWTALRDYAEWPTMAVVSWWYVVLTVTAALALTFRGSSRGQVALGRRRTVALTSAVAVLALAQPLEVALARIGESSIGAFGFNLALYGRQLVAGPITLVAQLVWVVTVLVCLVRAQAPLRRRVLAMSAPLVAVVLTVPWLFEGFLFSTVQFDPPVLLAPGQWAYLVMLPVAVFVAGALLVERAEHHARLIALGRAAERAERHKQVDPAS